jgi:uncharacterized protein (DUF1800 family)
MPLPQMHTRTALAAVVGSLVVAAAAPVAQRGDERLRDAAAIVHVLNRLAFGPSPTAVEHVRHAGVRAYIEEQLHPERLQDQGVASRLAAFSTLTKTTRELADAYFLPARVLQRQQRRPDPATMGSEPAAPARAPVMTAAVRMQRLPMAELSQQKILRAVYSDRQLEEVLVDFWFNHFNVFVGKGQVRLYLTEYERDAIRPHALGRFRDLLGATAESPAMLFYLDNWQSAAEEGAQTVPRRPRAPARTRPNGAVVPPPDMPTVPAPPRRRSRGLNENYARELMELHTLGVDGGYSQKDVQEVARAFTGWTIDRPAAGGSFRFDPRRHDNGEKVVLGHRIPAGGGKRDGDRVLDILAAHPATARFIATKLARRFVSDNPPAALVGRAAATFRKTDGDLRQVVRTILLSDEFLAPETRRAKIKSPLEFVASAVRATDADVRHALPLVQSLRDLGMPLYGAEPPTGYADRASAWVNTGALLSRMNFALALTSGELRGVGWQAPGSPEQSARTLAAIALAGELSPATQATVARASTAGQAAALILGSPEFQKR